ncbi:MAG: hypothetical protein KAT04_01830, partial [Methylococcales bacterium]|nr:hypothetical protein [Methylococcales bacterium]
MENIEVKKTLYLLVILVSLFIIGCKTTVNIETDNSYRLIKWRTILLASGEFFEYQTKDSNHNLSIISLEIKQGRLDELQALWKVKQGSKIILSKLVNAPQERLIVVSQPALITEKIATPFLSTILMNWWSRIDYFRWEIGFKRAI